ncbi:hypothetical protein AB0J80_23650 [Actinoplanes sp. NPDC049548]|uniref:hypothetical protein n=1 Tax=Actinoplanes sp. NPDC049548 TaxID=3155152 RepID=UPI0034281D2B
MRITPRFARVSAVSAVLAGVLLTQQACGGQTSAATPSTGSPGPSATAATGIGAGSGSPAKTAAKTSAKAPARGTAGVFSGTREVWLLPVATEGTLAVSKSNRVELSDQFGDRALFVLTKVEGDRYWIRTARLRTGGEASCLQANKDKTVTAAACDAARSDQLFRFRKTGTSENKPKYTIRTNGDIYLIVTRDGGVRAEHIGEGTPDIDTPFLLPDRGKASMPALD